jgi:drug/metabolite transporter (DMT)-like permease
MFARFTSKLSPAAQSAPGDLSPSKMRGNEPLMGYGAALVIAIVAALNLTITTGTGAPAHPEPWTSVAGIVLAVALAASIRLANNRLISPFIAIFGAFFVTLSKAPSSLSAPHIVALIAAVGFALVVSMRQRREQKLVSPPLTADQRRAAADARRRRRKGEPEPASLSKRPAANRRYTPPKDRSKEKPRR